MTIPVEDIRYLIDCTRLPRLEFRQHETIGRVEKWLDSLLAKKEPVTPAVGQVWQKRNVGNKTATNAPRITIKVTRKRMVYVRDQWNGEQWMRITTLQRDWYCLNP
jgi:hypothetical protein